MPKRSDTPEDASDALKGLHSDYLDCRDLRHPFGIVGYFRDNGHVCRRLECPRCGMVAVDSWYASGVREARRYYPPDGYYLSGSGVTAQDVRLEVMRRARGHIARSERALVGG